MAACVRCGAELQAGAKFCVMCGTQVDTQEVPAFATATLTGSGLTVAISTAAICAVIAAGAFVLIRTLL